MRVVVDRGGRAKHHVGGRLRRHVRVFDFFTRDHDRADRRQGQDKPGEFDVDQLIVKQVIPQGLRRAFRRVGRFDRLIAAELVSVVQTLALVENHQQ